MAPPDKALNLHLLGVADWDDAGDRAMSHENRFTVGATLAAWATALAVGASPAALLAVELKPSTVAAFDRYVAITEARMEEELRRGAFLLPETLAPSERHRLYDQLRRGGLVVRRQATKDNDRAFRIPDGFAHHWIGVVFLPRATLSQTLSMAQAYDRHAEFFGEVVKRSRLVAREGSRFTISQRFMLKRILTGVADVDSDVDYTPVDASRVRIRARSTRVAEVEDAFTANERVLPVGKDNGYLWRVNSYWRIEQVEGGTYLQVEWLSLSRDAPFGLRWLIEPIVLGLSRDSLELTLRAARRLLSGD